MEEMEQVQSGRQKLELGEDRSKCRKRRNEVGTCKARNKFEAQSSKRRSGEWDLVKVETSPKFRARMKLEPARDGSKSSQTRRKLKLNLER